MPGVVGSEEKGGGKAGVRDLLAGGFAGGVARMFVAPLDVIKIRFQVMGDSVTIPSGENMPKVSKEYRSLGHAAREITAQEGVRALWKGNIPALVMIIPYVGIQFSCYQYYQRKFRRTVPQPYLSMVSGSFSAVVATFCTYPLDLIRTRLAVQTEPRKYTGLFDAVRKIRAEEGSISRPISTTSVKSTLSRTGDSEFSPS